MTHRTTKSAFGYLNDPGTQGVPLLLVGEPFAAEGAGVIHVLDGAGGGQFAEEYAQFGGQQPGAYLGAGPIRVADFRLPLRSDMTAYGEGQHGAIVVGAPYAYGGTGLVAVYLWTGETLVYVGSENSAFGAALSPSMDFNGDGATEVFVGVPGYADNAGAVFPLGNDLLLGASFITGEAGNRVGFSIGGGPQQYEGSILTIGAAGVTDTNGWLLGQWADFRGPVGAP